MRNEAPPAQPSTPSPDPAQFFVDFTQQISDYTRDAGKKERLKLKTKQEDTILNRATARRYNYPSYLSQARVFKAEQKDQLVKIDRQLETHKKRQAEFSQVFSQMVSKNNADPQLKLDIENSKSNSAVAMREAQEVRAELAKFDMDLYMNHLNTAIEGLKEIQETKEQVNALEAELLHLKQLRSDLQSLLDKSQTTPQTLAEHAEQFNKVCAEQNSFKDKIADFEKASVNLEFTWLKRLDDIEASFAAQRQLLENRVAEIENSKTTSFSGPQALPEQGQQGQQSRSADFNILKSDLLNLFGQLEKLRDLQELKDQEIDKELQRLDTSHSKISEIEKTVKYHGERLDGVQVAITSLETRYNSLTTEPLVRQMVTNMQEMYPFASTAQREIEEFRQAINNLRDNLHTVSVKTQTAEISQLTLKREQESEKSERLNMTKDMLAEKDRMDDIIKGALERIDKVEAVTADRLAEALFGNENTLAKLKATEEKLTKLSETLKTLSHSQNISTPDRGAKNNKDDMQIRGTNSATRAPPPLSTRTTMSSVAESPREPRGDREELRIRTGPSPPPPSAPTGPSRARTQGGGDLHHRVTLPQRAPPDSYKDAMNYSRADTYRPFSKKRRRGTGSDDSDY